jgi:hypothetical protein
MGVAVILFDPILQALPITSGEWDAGLRLIDAAHPGLPDPSRLEALGARVGNPGQEACRSGGQS